MADELGEWFELRKRELHDAELASLFATYGFQRVRESHEPR